MKLIRVKGNAFMLSTGSDELDNIIISEMNPPPSPNKPPLKIGDRVRLNDHGFETLPKLRDAAERNSANGILTISYVSDDEPAPGIWAIDVEGPLNHYMLSSADVDKINE